MPMNCFSHIFTIPYINSVLIVFAVQLYQVATVILLRITGVILQENVSEIFFPHHSPCLILVQLIQPDPILIFAPLPWRPRHVLKTGEDPA